MSQIVGRVKMLNQYNKNPRRMMNVLEEHVIKGLEDCNECGCWRYVSVREIQ